jgi:hypothetical protein
MHKLLFVISLTLVIFAVNIETAEAHKPWKKCHRLYYEPYQPIRLERCRKDVRSHITWHSKSADTRKCYRRKESKMPWGVCRFIVSAAWRNANRPYAYNPSLHTILQKESGGGDCKGRRWMKAVNCSSGACGLHQFLPCRGLSGTEHAKAGYRYIYQRYGSPEKALAFHRANGWY